MTGRRPPIEDRPALRPDPPPDLPGRRRARVHGAGAGGDAPPRRRGPGRGARSLAPPDGRPHFAPRAKSVIWIFLSGGVSHLETWDPKPALNKYAGKTYDATGLPSPFKSPLFRERSRAVVGGDRTHAQIFPLQVGFKKHGQAGVEISDWWPHLATCVDDIAFVRSMYTTDNDHAAEFQMHHGRHKLDERQPVIGSWIHYGLGTLNENLPAVRLPRPVQGPPRPRGLLRRLPRPAALRRGAVARPRQSLCRSARGPKGVTAEEQANEFALIRELNGLAAVEYPEDDQLRARIRAYELAYRMQAVGARGRSTSTASRPRRRRSTGSTRTTTAIYGRRLLAARRLAERGVRFTLVYLSDYGEWDSHTQLKDLHARSCCPGRPADRRAAQGPEAPGPDRRRHGRLLHRVRPDPGPGGPQRQRGRATGRDHHPHAFTVWFAGAGIKGGTVHGATDELGFHAVEHPHYVTDVHATRCTCSGLDPRRLDVPGRKRLEIDYGRPIRRS